MLSFAGLFAVKEGREGTYSGHPTSTIIHNGITGPEGHLPRHAGHIHDTAHSLGQRIKAWSLMIRPVLTKHRYRDINNFRIQSLYIIIPNTPPGHSAGFKVLDQHIYLSSQVTKYLLPFRTAHIYGNPFLIAVDA